MDKIGEWKQALPNAVDPTLRTATCALVEIEPSPGSVYLFRRELARFRTHADAEAAMATLAANVRPDVRFEIAVGLR